MSYTYFGRRAKPGAPLIAIYRADETSEYPERLIGGIWALVCFDEFSGRNGGYLTHGDLATAYQQGMVVSIPEPKMWDLVGRFFVVPANEAQTVATGQLAPIQRIIATTSWSMPGGSKVWLLDDAGISIAHESVNFVQPKPLVVSEYSAVQKRLDTRVTEEVEQGGIWLTGDQDDWKRQLPLEAKGVVRLREKAEAEERRRREEEAERKRAEEERLKAEAERRAKEELERARKAEDALLNGDTSQMTPEQFAKAVRIRAQRRREAKKGNPEGQIKEIFDLLGVPGADPEDVAYLRKRQAELPCDGVCGVAHCTLSLDHSRQVKKVMGGGRYG